MSELALAVGSVVVIAALCAVLVTYLYTVGSVVERLAGTLADKVQPGAAEVAEHVCALGPAAAGLRTRMQNLQGQGGAHRVPEEGGHR